MAKIGGLWFLLLGIAMIWFSLFIQSKNDSAKMSLFIIVGSVFIMIGTFKLIKKIILKDIKTPVQNQQRSQNQSQQQNPFQRQQPQIIRCPNCGARNYATNPFCSYCKMRFR